MNQVFNVALLVIVIAGCSSWLLLFVLLPQLRRRLIDYPNGRSSHSHPTPRGGGVSFVVVSSVASAFYLVLCSGNAPAGFPIAAVSLIALPLAIVGFLDDRHDLPASWRYGVQVATAFAVVLLSPLVTLSFFRLLLFVLLVIAVTALINFTNFMDGLDGLVSGCMVVALTSAAVKLAAPWPVWALVGSLAGFLCWNWSPATVFMGDVGSTFLGAVFAMLVLQTTSWAEAFALLLVPTPLFADACLCVPRRLVAGQRVFQGHRLHLFQRLHQAGWPHARVASLYVAATTALALALLCGGVYLVIGIAVLEILIGIWLDQKLAVPFAVASRN